MLKNRWLATVVQGLCAIAGSVAANLSCAQSNQVTELERTVAQAERTLHDEPYLAPFCDRLRDGQHFFHRGRFRKGMRPVVPLDVWEAHLKAQVAAGRSQADADNQLQEAKRRRNVVAAACNLDYWKAELAKARAASVTASDSAPATFAWSREPDANRVINAAGTLTGNFSIWHFNGVDSKLNDCRGSGKIWLISSIRDYWFGIWPRACVGTVNAGDGVARSNELGLVGIKSNLDPTK